MEDEGKQHSSSVLPPSLSDDFPEDEDDEDDLAEKLDREENSEKRQRAASLHEQRLSATLAVLQQSGAKKVLDLGCGEGRLLKLLLQNRQFERILGMDVSYRALEIAQRRLVLS